MNAEWTRRGVNCYHHFEVVIMVRTQVSFDPSMFTRAKAEARRRGISLAELVRRAMAQALGKPANETQKPWMRYAGIITGGHSDDSKNENIDAMVYGRRP
jgi:hypothetical protein